MVQGMLLLRQQQSDDRKTVSSSNSFLGRILCGGSGRMLHRHHPQLKRGPGRDARALVATLHP